MGAEAGDETAGGGAHQLFTGGDFHEHVTFADASELFRIADPQDAGLRGQAMDLPGNLTRFFPLINMGEHVLAHELAHRAADHFMGFLKVAGVLAHHCLLYMYWGLYFLIVLVPRLRPGGPGDEIKNPGNWV